jgi:DNA invertase Pin-like site-specific DNA recombinase
MRIALYARVSTDEQHAENQLLELRRYVAARGWADGLEFVDEGVSGAKTRRPALDRLLLAARRRQIDAVVCWRLDRLGRDLAHLLTVMNEWTALGVAFISLGEGIEATTPAGALQLHILGALAQFERGRLRERVLAGLARAKREGRRLGRRRTTALPEGAPRGLTVRQAAALWGCSRSTAARRLAKGDVSTVRQTPSREVPEVA